MSVVAVEGEAYQPKNDIILASMSNKGRQFLPAWYERFPWITICATREKVFCTDTRSLKIISFFKKGDDAFITKGFDNYKKAVEKFRAHEICDTHLEAQLKCGLLGSKSISEQLNTLTAKIQNERRCGFMKQLKAMQFLLRHSLTLHGHVEKEGNLTQLMLSFSEDDEILKGWIRDGKYMSHEIITCLMGQSILRIRLMTQTLLGMRLFAMKQQMLHVGNS